jgi:hypothetical protein
MDPVNKWLTVIILFMAAVLWVFWSQGTVERYSMSIEDMGNGQVTVYVLDTKDGQVQAQIVDKDEVLVNAHGKPHRIPKEIFEWHSPGPLSYRKGY